MIAKAIIDCLIPSYVKGTNFVRRPSPETQSSRTTETSKQASPGKSEGHGFLGHLIEINGSIDDPKEKANVIQNCVWINTHAESVLNHADANIHAGRVPWSGAKKENKIPISKRLYFLSGGTDREFYSNNELLYQLANATKLSLQKGTRVNNYFDIDGCISDKRRRPYATREAQPLEQIYELYMIIKLLSRLGIKVTTNTNRAPFTTAILVTPKALKPFTNTDNPHNSPMIEIVGLDPKIACEMSKSLGIGALSTGFRDLPGEDTFIHPKLRLMYDIFNELGENFWDDFVKNAAVEYKCTTVEPKGLNSLLMLQDSCSVPSYKSFLKISAIKDHYVTRDKNKSLEKTKKEYNDYGDELLKHIEDRKEVLKILSEIEELLKDKEKNITEGRNVNDNATDIELIRLVRELNLIKLRSQFSEVPSISLRDDLESVRKDLENVKSTKVSYVTLPGENEPNSERINYTDSFGQSHKVLNPYNLLLHAPQMFDRKIRRSAHTNVCFHYDDPLNIKRVDLVDRQIGRLESAENKTGKSEKKIRHLIQEGNLRMISDPRLSKAERDAFKAFINKGKDILDIKSINDYVSLEKAKEYLKWRLEEFIVLRNNRAEIKKLEVDGVKIFNCNNDGVKFNQEFLNLITSESLRDYIGHLRENFLKAGGLGTSLVHYAADVYTSNFIDTVDAFNCAKLEEVRMYPDHLFNINYRKKYNGKDEKKNNLLSVGAIEDKRDRNQDYVEFLPNLIKADIVPDCSSTYGDNQISFTYGDSPTSDLSAHIQALLGFTFVDGEIHGGVASQIYNLILEEDYKKACIDKLLQLTKDAKEKRFDKFSEFCSKTGLFGLEEVKDASKNVVGYKKITGVKGQKIGSADVRENTYINDEEIFSKEQIQKDFIEVFARHRIVTNEAPDANIRRLFEAVCHIFGLNVAEQEFKQSELDKALACSKKTNRTAEEDKLVEKYKPVIAELERGRYMPYDTPDSRKYFEYIDDTTGEKYYRYKDTKLLTTKDGSKVYRGNEKDLRKRAIIDEVVNGEYGVLVYEDSLNVRGKSPEIFNDLDFLNEKCLYEDSALPPPSPPSGFFSSKLLIGLLGGGEKGINNLKHLISKMPKIFSGILEWSGGFMALGGIARIVSSLFGASEESIIYRGGYWVSNIARATSACGGALRGLVHPQKYYDITMGEVVNAFSAILLPNGLKHFGFAWGNTAIFTGRARQSIQRQLTTNLKPAKNGVIIENPREGDKDPKALQTELTKFSSEEIVLKISNATAKAGIPHIIGDWVGTMASAVLTPIRHIEDIIKDPSLLTVKQWISENSGMPFRNFKSVGHVLTSVGVLSGLFATIGGLFGKMEKLGELSESGFNSIGRWALSAATAIPALGIIANGFEVAANAEGIPKTTRGLDGKTIVYNPKRAGLSQVLAGLIYAVVPWFDLSKSIPASLFDIGTGVFFGLPKLKIGVAAEDEYTALKEAENSLFKGPYFERVEEKILPAVKVDSAVVQEAA